LLLVVRERKKEYFYYLYTVGVILFITISVIINVGMNMGIFPVTGIALPFVSYGGSSIVSTMILIGLAL
ncbi:MAG: FtsW/RodA/SpoVE family cell cycle protein, partial [Microgenomates group bacterium]